MKIKIHFHADADGVTSAALAAKRFDELGINYSLHSSLGASTSIEGDLNLVLDIPKVTGSFSKFNLVLDHHKTEVYDCFHVNPRFLGFDFPASFLSYIFFGRLEWAWIAAIGIVGDWAFEKVPWFWEAVKKEYPGLVIGNSQEEVFERSPLGRAAEAIDAIIGIEKQEGAIFAVNALRKLSHEEFFSWQKEARRLKDALEKINAEVEQILGREIVTEKAVYLRYSSKYRIKSKLAGILARKYRNKLVIVVEEQKDKLRFSLRNGNNLHEIAAKLSSGIGEGGGHPEAAGGHVLREHEGTFLKRLERLINTGAL